MYETKFACEVKGFDPLSIWIENLLSVPIYCIVRNCRLQEAMKDSELNLEKEDRERIGVITVLVLAVCGHTISSL